MKEKDRIRCIAAVVCATIWLPVSEVVSSFSPAMTPFLRPAGGHNAPAHLFALPVHDYFFETPIRKSFETELGWTMRSIGAGTSVAWEGPRPVLLVFCTRLNKISDQRR